MRKSIKRALSVALAVAVMFGESAIANAAETVIDVQDGAEQAVIEEGIDEDSFIVDESEAIELEIPSDEENASDEQESVIYEESVEDEQISEEVIDEETVFDDTEMPAEEEQEDTEVSEDESVEDTEEAEEIEEVENAEWTEMFAGFGEKRELADGNDDLLEANEDNFEAIGLDDESSYVKDEIIVEADSLEQAEEYARAFSGELVNWDCHGLALIRLNADDNKAKATVSDAVIASMTPGSFLPAAVPNTIMYFCGEEETLETDDSEVIIEEAQTVADEAVLGALRNDKAFLDSTAKNYQWHHDIIGTPEAKAAGYAGDGASIAVVDSGLDNTSISDASGVSKVVIVGTKGSDVTPTDDGSGTGHGTHVCGIIKIKKNDNSIGIADKCELTMIKVTNSKELTFTYFEVGQALAKIIAHEVEANIVNLSFGSGEYNAEFEKQIKQLYNGGVTVFCAAGNGGADTTFYPAAYSGAYSVAALDKNNQRAYFSNYGKKVKYAFPGVEIVASKTDSGYMKVSGTSESCAMASATAAVIYGAHSEELDKLNGKARVDRLISYMDRGAVKVSGTGLGKGYVSLPKALGIASTTTAPAAPYIESGAPESKPFPNASVDVLLKTYDANTEIYYTLDGKNPEWKLDYTSYDTYKLTDDGLNNTKKINVGGAAKVTLKAIAVNKTNWKVSSVMTAKYEFKPVQGTLSLATLSGNQIAQGTSVQVGTAISPAYVTDTRLNWSVEPSGAGATVNSKGLVSLSATSPLTEFTVKCTPVLPGIEAKTIKFTTVKSTENLIKSISVTNVKDSKLTLIADYSDYAALKLKTEVKYGNGNVKDDVKLKWYSLDSLTATVSSSATATPTVEAYLPGSTYIIGVAQDGSGTLVKIKVTVKQGPTSITIDGPVPKNVETLNLVAGKSMTVKAVMTPSYTTDKSVTWSVTPADKGVTISKKGVLKASKNAVLNAKYTVKAVSKINPTVSKSFTVNVINTPVSKIMMQKTAQIFRRKNGAGAETSINIPVTVTGMATTNWDVKSDNPKLVSASKKDGKIVASVVGEDSKGFGTGTVTLTAYATDGSGKKATCKVKVVNPASGLTLSTQSGRSKSLAYNKKMKLSPHFIEGYGAVDSKAAKFKWVSSKPDVIRVDEKGNITALSYKGETADITATAQDGSGVSATITITACDNVKFELANSSYDIGMKSSGKVRIYAVPANNGALSEQFTATVSGGTKGGLNIENYSTDTSNPTGKEVKTEYIVTCYGKTKGKYTLTFKPSDGSAVSKKIKVKVK
ncbi:MAG: S8 family serine peptidase [Lachnospiraceae bacterium]|nr:S8 family serine peptidase [Lachnospiraceae bacterium]